MTNNIELLKNHLYKLIKEELEDENPEENPTGDVSLKDITIGYSIPTDNPSKVEKAINNLDNYGDKQRQAVTIAQNIKRSAGGESKAMKLIPSGNAAGRNNIVKWSLTNVWDKLNKQERLTKLDQVFKAYKAEGKDIGEALKTIILKFDKEADLSDDNKIKEYIANLEASSPIFTKVGGGNNIGYPIFRKGYFYPAFTQKELERSPLRKDYEYTIEDKDGKSEFIFLVKDNPLADVNMSNTDAYRDLLKRIAKDAGEKLNTLSKQVFSDTGEDVSAPTISAPIKEPSSETTNFIKTFTDDEGASDEDSADLFYATILSDFPDADITDNKISVNGISPAEKKDLINRYLKFQQSNKLYENPLPMNNQLKEQLTSIIKEVLTEKKLTPAKLKKRNKTAEKIKKANPKMDKGEAFAIATKQLKEGETSMDDILLAFQAALDIEDDAKQDEALNAVYRELKNKVKSGASNLYQKVRTGFAKSQGIDPSELNEVEEETDAVDTITMDVPLFIRMLEYAKEDASADVDLHDVAENAVSLNKQQDILSMDDYDALLPSDAEPMGEARLNENLKTPILNTSQKSTLNSYIKNPATLAQALLALYNEIMPQEKFDPKTTAPFKVALDNMSKLSTSVQSSPQTKNTPTQPEKP
jgi:hypothetical protein